MYGVLSEISGILLCYGPLALTVLGFIAFAALTDVDARRTYLRRLDLRKETEQPEQLPPVITKRTVAETPSGARVILVPPDNGDERAIVRGESAAKVNTLKEVQAEISEDATDDTGDADEYGDAEPNNTAE